MNLMLYNFIIDFCGMIKLYLVMSCHSWSDMYLNHISFVLWLISSLNDESWFLELCSYSSFFEQSSHLHILVGGFCHFLYFSLNIATASLTSPFSLVYIFRMSAFRALSFDLSLSFQFFSVLLCQQVLSFSFHRHYFSTYNNFWIFGQNPWITLNISI